MVSPRKPIVEWPQSYYWHWYNQPILFSMFFNFLLLFISFPPSPHIRVYNLFSLFLILPQKHCLSEASTSGPAHFQAPSLWPGQWTTKFQPVWHFYLLLFFLLAPSPRLSIHTGLLRCFAGIRSFVRAHFPFFLISDLKVAVFSV